MLLDALSGGVGNFGIDCEKNTAPVTTDLEGEDCGADNYHLRQAA
jgi:hypothetical protein